MAHANELFSIFFVALAVMAVFLYYFMEWRSDCKNTIETLSNAESFDKVVETLECWRKHWYATLDGVEELAVKRLIDLSADQAELRLSKQYMHELSLVEELDNHWKARVNMIKVPEEPKQNGMLCS